MYYYVTTYSFDNDRPVQGPFGDFDACWDAMLKDAKNEYRIDVEEDGFTAELREDHDTGVINLVRLVDDTDDDTTTWSAIELPAHGPAKVYNVVGATMDGKNGAICPVLHGVSRSLRDAQDVMRKVYKNALRERGLEDNGTSDEDGNAIPGGYYTDREAGIYDYAEFANDQLLEMETFVIVEGVLQGDGLSQVPNVIGCDVYVVGRKLAKNSLGRVYEKKELEIFEASVYGIALNADNDFVLAVTEDRMLDGEERSHFGRCAEYVYGKEAFLTLREAMARREEVAHSEHKI